MSKKSIKFADDMFELSSASDIFSDNDDIDEFNSRIESESFLNESKLRSSKQKKPCMMIHPNNKYKTIWDVLIAIFLVIFSCLQIRCI